MSGVRGVVTAGFYTEEPLAVAVRKVLAAPRKRDVFLTRAHAKHHHQGPSRLNLKPSSIISRWSVVMNSSPKPLISPPLISSSETHK